MKTAAYGALALAVTVLALTAVVTSASAEFFGCNEPKRTSYSTRSYSAPTYRTTSSRYTHEFAAQSSRRSYSGRSYRQSSWR